jgi:tight adherence protein C
MNELVHYLPKGVTPEDVVIYMAGISAFLTVIAVWYGLIVPQQSGRRVKELAQRREMLKAGVVNPTRRKNRQTSTSFMRSFVMKLNLQRSQQAETITRRLAQAGWRSNDALVRYLFFKATMPIIMGIIAVIALYGLNIYAMANAFKLLSTAGAIMFGFIGPDLFIKNAVSKRQTAIRKGLPDALDLMVICAEAGLSLDAMLKRVSEEFAQSSAQLAEELQLTSLEVGFLPDRRQAPAEPQHPHEHARYPRRRERAHPERQVRHAPGPVAARPVARVPRGAHAAGRGKGGPVARDDDGADDHLHSAAVVHRAHRSGHPASHGRPQQVRLNRGEHPPLAKPPSAPPMAVLLSSRLPPNGRSHLSVRRRHGYHCRFVLMARAGAGARHERRGCGGNGGTVKHR